MYIHPGYDPVALAMGPLKIHWYALGYVAGFFAFLYLARRRVAKGVIPRGMKGFDSEQLDLLFYWGMLGVVIGGRLGYCLFYKPGFFLSHPLEILMLQKGGMSFHGGLLGVIVAGWAFARRQGYAFADVADFEAPLMVPGLFFGRLGNYVNGELWGRVAADWPWAMGFPRAHLEDRAYVAAMGDALPESLRRAWESYGLLPRHPSQLYEAFFEGLVLTAVLLWFSSKPRKRLQTFGLCLALYGCFRFLIEFARQPDDFLGILGLGMSMGQWLCLPMALAGGAMLLAASRKSEPGALEADPLAGSGSILDGIVRAKEAQAEAKTKQAANGAPSARAETPRGGKATGGDKNAGKDVKDGKDGGSGGPSSDGEGRP